MGKLAAIESFVKFARNWDVTYHFSEDPYYYKRGRDEEKALHKLADNLAEKTSRQFVCELYGEIMDERFATPEDAARFKWVLPDPGRPCEGDDPDDTGVDSD